MYISTLPDVKGRNYEVLGILRTFLEPSYYGNDINNLIDIGKKKLSEDAKDLGADGVIGLTIVSSSTYNSDDEGTYPDIIMYGSAIRFID